jgi:hypothetical protein
MKPLCGSRGFAGPSACILRTGHEGPHQYGNFASAVLKDESEELERLRAENDRLRFLVKLNLDAREKEAAAAISLENAQENFHRFYIELHAYEQAAIEASKADSALREALAARNEEQK